MKHLTPTEALRYCYTDDTMHHIEPIQEHRHILSDIKAEERIRSLYEIIYPHHTNYELLNTFLSDVQNAKEYIIKGKEITPKIEPEDWFREIVVYCLYVDTFNKTFQGLEEKLDYLVDLGVTCLWILPILDSPLHDGGFDIRDYFKIRKELLGLNEDVNDKEWTEAQWTIFSNFRKKAHAKGLKIIIDCPFNHTSNQHFWFQQAKQGKNNPFRDYYIWSDTPNKYKDCRIIFEGLETSNWTKEGDEYFMHRFFKEQPDLNYRNPNVLLDIGRVLLSWIMSGIDGFRADAIPFLWKEEGTNCESLETTHFIVKFYRSVLDFVRPGTLLLAESCQLPNTVVDYFGNGDECHAAYHFPLMPEIYRSIYEQRGKPIIDIMDPINTPSIPIGCQWFTFLRCHDELTLEMVPETVRETLFNHYCKQKEWNFRNGQGISSRLRNLLETPELIQLAHSILLTIIGTPIIYYGDEFGMENDYNYFNEMKEKSGHPDSRYLVRGRVDWEKHEKDLKDPNSFASKIFYDLKKKLEIRKQFSCLKKGFVDFYEIKDELGNDLSQILAYVRHDENDCFVALHNMSKDKTIEFISPIDKKKLLEYLETNGYYDLLGKKIVYNEKKNTIKMEGHSHLWIKINK